MNITSRYSDIPSVSIDESKIPVNLRPLLELAAEWSISDDMELDEYIQATPLEQRRHFFETFKPHFDELARWHQESRRLRPQPDELVLFDIAANAAATVGFGVTGPG